MQEVGRYSERFEYAREKWIPIEYVIMIATQILLESDDMQQNNADSQGNVSLVLVVYVILVI